MPYTPVPKTREEVIAHLSQCGGLSYHEFIDFFYSIQWGEEELEESLSPEEVTALIVEYLELLDYATRAELLDLELAAQGLLVSSEDVELAPRFGDVLYNISDQYTHQVFTATKTTVNQNGDAISDDDVDNIIFFKRGSEYFKRNYTDIDLDWFNTLGNNSAIDTNGILLALEKAKPGERIFGNPLKSYVLNSEITLTKPVKLDFRTASMRGLGLDFFFKAQSNDVTFDNLTMDGDYTCYNFIRAEGLVDNKFSGLILNNVHFKNQITTAGNLDGGLYLIYIQNIYVNRCSFENINNVDAEGGVDHSPAMKFYFCDDVVINEPKLYNVGVGINTISVRTMFVNDINMEEVNNNGFYIQGATTGLKVTGGFVKNCKDAGFVYKTSSEFTDGTDRTTTTVSLVEFSNTDEVRDVELDYALEMDFLL